MVTGKRKGTYRYHLIWDTGDSIFDTKKDAFKFASYLRKKGRKVDRLQLNRYSGKSYKTMPKVFKKWK